MNTISGGTFLGVTFLFCANAHAQFATPPPSPEAPTTPAAEPAVAPAPAPAATTGVVVNLASRRDAAMVRYSLGESGVALQELRALALECGTYADGRCSESASASIYACVGIVLSGASGDHDGGVRAFRKSLAMEPNTVISQDYQTRLVMDAYREAKTGQVAPAAPASDGSQPATQGTYSQQPEGQQSPPPVEGNLMSVYALAGGGLKVGVATETGGDSPAFIQGEGALSILGAPGAGQFLVGGRLRGGTLMAEGAGEGYLGTSLEMGGVFGERRDQRFSFLLMGTGIQHFPGLESTRPTAHVRVGHSFGGLMVAGGMDLTWGFESHIVLFGAEIGFGGGM